MSDLANFQPTYGNLLEQRKERGTNADPLLSVSQESGVLLQEEAGRREIASLNRESYWRVYPGDLVYNTMRMWQGASAISQHYGIVSPAYTVCCPRPGVVPEYVGYLAKLPEMLRSFTRLSQGITSDVWNLKYRYFSTICVPLHGETEQRRIADILGTVDVAIRDTEALIAKYRQIKAGMMHDLFTRGITPDGRLRPPYTEAPDQYKPSPLGPVVNEWGVVSIGSQFEIQLGKMLNKAAKTGRYSAIYLGNRAVQWDQIDVNALEEMDFSPVERARFRLEPDDLLVCEGGEVGRTAIWNGELDECYYQKAVHRLRSIDDQVKPRFMLHFMRFAHEVGIFRRYTSQSSIAHLTQEKLSIMLMKRPPKEEQFVIANRIDALNGLLESERLRSAKLRSERIGLMQRLLGN